MVPRIPAGRTCTREEGRLSARIFMLSILLPIPSCLTDRDEDDVIAAFEKVLKSCLKGKRLPVKFTNCRLNAIQRGHTVAYYTDTSSLRMH